MHTNPESTESYVGTSFAAKMLNLSVGTVQTLVSKGELPAYLTSGGHRRIPYNAVLAYSKKNKVPLGAVAGGPSHGRSNEVVRICVLHGDKFTSPNLEKIAKDGAFQVVTDPMKLIKPNAQMTHIFMDARIDWVDWARMEPSADERIHYVIYNSGVLSANARKHLETVAVLLNTDITLEFLHGYRIGFQSGPTEYSAPVFPHMVRQ